MNRLICIAAALLVLPLVSCSTVSEIHVAQAPWAAAAGRCEYLRDPMGIDIAQPRLSWELSSRDRGAVQSAYQIQVASSQQILENGKPDLWESGKVASRDTNQIAYGGNALVSRERCYWRVRSWNGSDQPTSWTHGDFWEMGLLKPSDWQAKFIQTDPAAIKPMEILSADFHSLDGKVHKDVADVLRKKIDPRGRLTFSVNPNDLGGDPAPNQVKELTVRYTIDGRELEVTSPENRGLRLPPEPVRILNKSFAIHQPVKRARLYVTALGLYHGQLNGRRIEDNCLSPGWTDYRQRVQYQTYDVTDWIRPGKNDLGLTLASGWYAGYIGNGKWHRYGDAPSLLAQLEVQLADGSTQIIATDESWTSRRGQTLASDNMYGEWCDSTTQPGTSADRVVLTSAGIPPRVVAQSTPPVMLERELKPKSVVEAPKGSGRWVYDLGQNMVGTAAIDTHEPAGAKLTLRYGEALDPDGSLYVANLRGAVATDTYICHGGGDQWNAGFSYHGFRYVELSGVSKPPAIDAVKGLVYCSFHSPSGESFTCSSGAINQLQSNIEWGQRGNFVSVPTDCPQRDERQGWMGDAEVFIQSALYNADLAAFYNNWLVDVDFGQTAEGAFSDVSPDVLDHRNHGTPAWGDAGVICPWTVYEMYGDRRELEQNYPSMKRWVDWCHQHSADLIRDKDRGADYGDWLNDHSDTPKDLIGTAFFARSADLVARSAEVLGKTADAKQYHQLFLQTRDAFGKRYLDESRKLRDDTQTAETLAIEFDLLESEPQRTAVGDQLVRNVRNRGTRLSTGFVGVSHLLPALTHTGHADVAYELLLQDAYPSWLFSVKQGATTIWERWDGWTPEKGFQDISMNSLNHYSLGSCGQWFYQTICGIGQKKDSVGFREFEIHPILPPLGKGGQPLLTHASATYHSINGPISSAWKIVGENRVQLTVEVPANCTARVFLPGRSTVAEASGVRKLPSSEDHPKLEIGSGHYEFECEYTH